MTDKKEYALLAISSLLLVGILSYLFSTGGLMTGLVALTADFEDTFSVNSDFEENNIIDFSENRVSDFRATGSYTGEGSASVYINTSDGLILVYSVQNSNSEELAGQTISDDELVSSSFSGVMLLEGSNESDEVVNGSEDSDEEVVEEQEESEQINESDETIDEGSEEVVEEESDEESSDTESDETIEEVVNESEEESVNETFENETSDEIETINFQNECVDSCSLNEVDINNVIVEVNGGVLTLDSFSYTSTQEVEIIQTNTFENETIVVGETLEYDLTNYFDGTIDSYDARNSNGYEFEISGNTLTITGTQQGTWRSRVYAIGNEVVESNDFIIEIMLENESENLTEDINDTTDEVVNESEEESVNETSEETEELEQIQESEEQTQTQEQQTIAVRPRIEQVPTNLLEGIISQGEEVEVLGRYYEQASPERGDIITYNHVTSRTPIYKRIVGMPGDEMGWSGDGKLTLNGEIVMNTQGEPYQLTSRQENMLHLYVGSYETIPEDTYLIFTNSASNPRGSASFGLVHVTDFDGKVTW